MQISRTMFLPLLGLSQFDISLLTFKKYVVKILKSFPYFITFGLNTDIGRHFSIPKISYSKNERLRSVLDLMAFWFFWVLKFLSFAKYLQTWMNRELTIK